MSCIIKAVLYNPNIPENGVATISFPLGREEYAHSISEVLEPMGIGSAITQDCFVGDIESRFEVLRCLKNQMVNVDELDYLAKRLDSFCISELKEYQAACYAFGIRDIKDLINMTFCCQETTVISDFSKLEEVGKAHYLTIHGGSAPADELATVDGKTMAEKLILSGEGKPTPYGLFFRNGMRMERPYRGNSFPPHTWQSPQAELELTKPDGTTALIFLPFSELEFRRFLQRECILDTKECKCSLYLYLRQENAIEIEGNISELMHWNELCDSINAMSSGEQQILATAIEVTGAEDLAQLKLLASSLNDFDLIPGVSDAESYGKYMIQKSGRYGYDEALDCYYNYEAFGEFLMTHEVGQITKHGYLKCEEDSVFLDFFTQEQQTHASEQSPADADSFMQMGGMSQ